jgi:hypothetical protein
LSPASSASQAEGCVCRDSHSQINVDLPETAGAEINVTLRTRPASRRSINAGRDTSAACKRGVVSLVYNRSAEIGVGVRLGIDLILPD